MTALDLLNLAEWEKRAVGRSYGVHTGHDTSLQTNVKEFKIYKYQELLENCGSNRESIRNLRKNSSSGKKLERNAI